MLLSIGTDTEIFAVDKKGTFRSLCGLVGGTKDHPKQLDGLPDGYAVQEDNVSLEFNIPPAFNKTQFEKSIKLMLGQTAQILAAHNLKISHDASATFPKEELLHPNALVFGCEPDYNAWKMCENPRPRCENEQLRTAGGHIHLGIEGIDMVQAIRNMDLFVGVPSVLLDNSPASLERRKLYGKGGAMRPKPYGAEYRTLSNFWVFDSKLIKWVFDQTKAAMNFKQELTEDDGELFQHIINTGDQDAAKTVVANYGLALPA